MKHALYFCLIFLITSCYQVEEKATTASMKDPNEFRWRSLPQTIHIASDDLLDDVEDMTDTWNGPFITRILHTGTTHSTFESIKKLRDFKNTIYLVEEDKWPDIKAERALGVTILLGRTNDDGQYIIEEADIIIRKEKLYLYDSKTILLHELGHLLGLQHHPSRDSIMYDSIDQNEAKHIPTDDDYLSLARLYRLPYGNTPRTPRKVPVAEGKGALQRIILELGADKICRHLINGEEVESHQVHL